MVLDPNNLQEFNHRFMRIVQAAVEQSPTGLNNGILMVEKTPQGVCCELSDEDTGQAIAIPDSVRHLSQEFANFKRTDNWNNEWSKMTIRYSFDDPSVDYTATREFTYSETTQPVANPSLVPDAAFWRQETAHNAWQRSASLLVIEFILDCEDWKTGAEDTTPASQQRLTQLVDKFCASHHSVDWKAHLQTYPHKISDESVYSTESVGAKAIVQTVLQNSEAERFFEYRLIHDGDRWFLDRVIERTTRAENISDLRFT